MAHFIGYLQGNRGGASRLGTKASSMDVSGRGWQLGADVYVYYDEQAKEDRVTVTLTGGSNRSCRSRELGTFRRKGQRIVKVS